MNNTTHPFGSEITPDNLIMQFSAFTQWEERYRQLILLAKKLPSLSDNNKTAENELTGCENRVWLGYSLNDDGTLHFYGDSEGRIVKGLIAILLTHIEGKTPQQLRALDPLALLETLQLRDKLTATRDAGLLALSERVKGIARGL